jgi:hypothetical protein
MVRWIARLQPKHEKRPPSRTAIACRPSSVNETGADTVVLPSGPRRTSRPVSASSAKRAPPELPKLVSSRPVYSPADGDGTYFHFRWPVATSSATIFAGRGLHLRPAAANKQSLLPRITLLQALLRYIDLLQVKDLFRAPRRSSRPARVITPVMPPFAAMYSARLPLRERSEKQPLSAYGADKLGCELMDPKSPFSGVISIFCERIRRVEPIEVFGDGHQR